MTKSVSLTTAQLDRQWQADIKAAAAMREATAAVTGQAAAQQALRNNVVAFTSASTAAAAGTKLAAHEVTNLTRQLSDIGVSLASGQSPFMVMIQQGAQLQDIMGKRGLGQVLTGLVAGIGSLATPTTAILLGVTALGYAARAVYGAMQGDVENVNLKVKDHLDLIDQVARKWGGQVPALKAYNDELERTKNIDDALKALGAVASEQYEAVRKELPALTVDIADVVGQLTNIGSADQGGIAAFQGAFAELKDKIADASATAEDARKVQKSLSAEALGVSTPAIKALAKAFGDYADEVERASKNADAFRTLPFDGKIYSTGPQDRNGDGKRDYSQLGPLNSLDGFNFTPFQSPEDMWSDRARRQRDADENKRLGGLVPIPTRRPNLEDEPSRAQELLRSQDESIERLKVEALAIGQSEAVRARMIAQMEAEQDIRRAGIDAQGEEAQRYRDGAAALADYTTEVNRHRDAWNSFEKASENALDKVLDKLSNGDFEGALDALLSDFRKFFTEFGVANPLKNALLGQNNPTLGDIGRQMLGGALGDDPARPVRQQAIAQISGNVVRMPLAGIAANDNLASGDIAGYIRQAAKLRGIDPEIALRVARSEGGLKDPFRQGEAMLSYGREESFGPFQLHMRQGGVGTRALKAGIDPRTNWQGGVDYALDEAANKGWGQWFGAAKAGIGNREGLEGARAIGQLSEAAKKAAGGLSELDTGITSAVKAITGGPGGGFDLKSLFSPDFKESGGGFASLIGYGGAAKTRPKAGAGGGGFLELLLGFLPKLFGFRHGTEDAPPGWAWVGEEGRELVQFKGGEKVANARRSAEMAREFSIEPSVFRGGAGSAPLGGRNGGASEPTQIVFQNMGTNQRLVDRKSEPDGKGGRIETFILDDQVSALASNPSSQTHRTLGAMGSEPRRPLR